MMSLINLFLAITLIINGLTFGGLSSKEYDYEATEVTVTGIDFASGDSSQGIPGIHNSYYLDDDETLVTVWEDSVSIRDGAKNQISLMRIAKDGAIIHKKTIFESVNERPEDGPWTEMNIPFPQSIIKNTRGNTVVFGYYLRSDDNHDDDFRGFTYAFEEYDSDFNLIKSVEHNKDLPYNGNLDQYCISMDDNGYYYTGNAMGVFVYNADFEFLGFIEDMPVPEEYGYFIPVIGSDGACYVYFLTEEDRGIYKLDPVNLTSEYMFTLPLTRSAWLWRGDESDGALFYAVGAVQYTVYNEGSGQLLRIDTSGKATAVMVWEEQGIAPYFYGIGYTSAEDFDEIRSGRLHAQYSKNGDFYNLTVEDADGDSNTLDDRVLKLYSFYRVPKLD